MELNIQTFQNLAEIYLKYQFALYPLKFDAEPQLQLAVMQSHQSNTDTLFSLRKIVELKNVNDVYCLSRSMFESVINMGVLVSGKIKDAGRRFINFQYLEAYKILTHLKQIEPDFVDKIYKSEDIKIITEGRTLFVSEFGNIDNWCGLNLLDRIKLIDKNFSPICSNNKFFEYLYCQVYRKGSGAIHRTSTGLGRSTVWEKGTAGNLNVLMPIPNINHLIFGSIHSLIVYLASIRFMGHILEKGSDDITAFYHKETERLISGKG